MQTPESNAHQAIKQLFALQREVICLRKEINAVRSRLWLDVASGVIAAVFLLSGLGAIALNLAGTLRDASNAPVRASQRNVEF